MRVVVFGYHDMGAACLDVLLETGHAVAAVCTHRDDPTEGLWFASLAELAARRGLPVLLDDPTGEPGHLETLRDLAPDAVFSFSYRRLLGPEVLAVPRRGCFNLHPSLLPRFRGRCPVNWALIRGASETGVTLHHMVVAPDAGDIVGQERVPIEPDDDALTLHRKVVRQGARLLARLLPSVAAGTAPRRAQDLSSGSYFGRRRPEDGTIDWSRPAAEIHNLVRGVTAPWPGARTEFDGRRLLVWKTTVEDEAAPPAAPGTLLDPQAWTVATGRGRLRLVRCQLDGEPLVPAQELARCLGLAAGATFGALERV